jgi:dUTP pyrophosphatase
MTIVSTKEEFIPKKWSTEATCYDLFVAEETTILPWEVKLVPTWIKTNFASKIYARSSLAIKRKLILANSVWIIDKDYRGEIKVAIFNLSWDLQIIEKWGRIAQIEIEWPEQDILINEAMYEQWERFWGETWRGEGGFGSTWK